MKKYSEHIAIQDALKGLPQRIDTTNPHELVEFAALLWPSYKRTPWSSALCFITILSEIFSARGSIAENDAFPLALATFKSGLTEGLFNASDVEFEDQAEKLDRFNERIAERAAVAPPHSVKLLGRPPGNRRKLRKTSQGI